MLGFDSLGTILIREREAHIQTLNTFNPYGKDENNNLRIGLFISDRDK